MTVKEMAQEIKNIINTLQEENYYHCYGLRKDGYNYDINEECNYSHQLYQDPQYDEDFELEYPMIEEGPYKGYYDAGELNGTCCMALNENSSIEEIEKALNEMKSYVGSYLYIIVGTDYECGNDMNELIIEDAIVKGKWEL